MLLYMKSLIIIFASKIINSDGNRNDIVDSKTPKNLKWPKILFLLAIKS